MQIYIVLMCMKDDQMFALDRGNEVIEVNNELFNVLLLFCSQTFIWIWKLQFFRLVFFPRSYCLRIISWLRSSIAIFGCVSSCTGMHSAFKATMILSIEQSHIRSSPGFVSPNGYPPESVYPFLPYVMNAQLSACGSHCCFSRWGIHEIDSGCCGLSQKSLDLLTVFFMSLVLCQLLIT